MNVIDEDPQVVAAKLLVEGLKEGMKDMKPVMKEILEQFGISKEDGFKGLIPLAVLAYPPLKELESFLHGLVIIEGQIMNYLETLGADTESAIKTVQKAAVSVQAGLGVWESLGGVFHFV